MTEPTLWNRQKLAQAVTGEWTLSQLMEFVLNKLMDQYLEHPDQFQEEWKEHFPEQTKEERNAGQN